MLNWTRRMQNKTSLKILGWKSKNLRCPDHSVSFRKGEDNDSHKISLLQMPNGTGKTTLWKLLRTALSGDKTELQDDGIIEFKRKGSDDDYGSFDVSLLFNGAMLSIEICFDFDSCTVDFWTTYSKGKGRVQGFHPPVEAMRFLNNNFAKFFIFDGELASNFLRKDSRKTREVIDVISQLGDLNNINKLLDKYFEDSIANSGVSTLQGFNRRKSAYQEVKDTLDQRKKELEKLESDEKSAEESLIELTTKADEYIKTQKGIRERIEGLEKKLRNLDVEYKDLENHALNIIIQPDALSKHFAKRITNFCESLDKLKLPENVAREFFIELRNENNCICGRPMDKEAQREIKEQETRLLGSEIITVLNQLKSSKLSPEIQKFEDKNQELKGILEKMKENDVARRNCDTEIEMQKKSIDDEDYVALLDKKRNLEIKIDDINTAINKYYANSDSAKNVKSTYSIQVLEKELTKRKNEYLKSKEAQIIQVKSQLTKKLLENAYQEAQRTICSQITKDTNVRIEQVMPFNSIRIAGIEHYLHLEGQKGSSEGEKLSIAYAFLTSLFNGCGYYLPFIVDSPANPIDLEKRGKIAELVPKLAEQFVTFIISSERSGFLEALEKNESDIQYLTLFRNNIPSIVQKAKHAKSCQETENGMLVEDKDFFWNFQIQREEE